jgi:RES domain-containing protein
MAHITPVRYSETHRLIPTKHTGGGSVLETLNLPANVLSDLSELDASTNERKQAERGGNPALGPGELLQGVPEANIVNASFAHPGPFGGRFNDHNRGAWYAGVELTTAQYEVAYHKIRFLEESRIPGSIAFEYQDFLADFAGGFHHLDPLEIQTCLQSGPVPECYGPGQSLATTLLYSGSLGIIYPSVRKQGGTCIACFRPALVLQPRRGSIYQITVSAGAVWDESVVEL